MVNMIQHFFHQLKKADRKTKVCLTAGFLFALLSLIQLYVLLFSSMGHSFDHVMLVIVDAAISAAFLWAAPHDRHITRRPEKNSPSRPSAPARPAAPRAAAQPVRRPAQNRPASARKPSGTPAADDRVLKSTGYKSRQKNSDEV